MLELVPRLFWSNSYTKRVKYVIEVNNSFKLEWCVHIRSHQFRVRPLRSYSAAPREALVNNLSTKIDKRVENSDFGLYLEKP